MDKQTDEISREVGEILAEVDGDIARRRPVCRASGRCCRFEEYGHRLYVTGVELAFFKTQITKHETQKEGDIGGTPMPPGRRVSLRQFFATDEVRGCPYQIDGLCTAREARPLGCRIYFCDENAQAWQNEVYETYHAKLRAVHEKFGVPYRYLEWRVALRELIEDGEAACG